MISPPWMCFFLSLVSQQCKPWFLVKTAAVNLPSGHLFSADVSGDAHSLGSYLKNRDKNLRLEAFLTMEDALKKNKRTKKDSTKEVVALLKC